MAQTFTIRPMRPEDVGGVARLARDQIERGLGWSWTPTRVARNLARKDVLGVVAMVDDRPVGFAVASYGYEYAHLLIIAVRPDARSGGIGRGLVEWHERCARVAGLGALILEVRATNEGAQAFYERLGFEVTGVTKNYYQGREDALHMRLLLT